MTIRLFSRIPPNKRQRYRVFAYFIAMFTMIIFVGCYGEIAISETDPMILFQADKCSCDGSTLNCTADDGTTVSEGGSMFCNEQQLKDTNLCACDGTTLACDFIICKQEQSSGMCGFGQDYYSAGSCTSNSSTNYGQTWDETFENSPACALSSTMPPPPPATNAPAGGGGGVPATQAPSLCADRGGVSYTGDTCVCPGVIDKVTICGDGTKFDNVTSQTCTPTESCAGGGGEPEVTCGCGLFGAPPTGMGCSNGVIEECNVNTCGCKP